MNSRSKGQRGEREVRDILAKWWGSKFSRTPSSGAFATILQRGDLNVAGDVSTDDPSFPWVVEVKRHEKVTIDQILTAKKCLVFDWWKQVCSAAALENKKPLLIFRRNNQPWMFIMYDSEMRPMSAPGTIMYIESEGFGDDVALGLLSQLTESDPSEWKL